MPLIIALVLVKLIIHLLPRMSLKRKIVIELTSRETIRIFLDLPLYSKTYRFLPSFAILVTVEQIHRFCINVLHQETPLIKGRILVKKRRLQMKWFFLKTAKEKCALESIGTSKTRCLRVNMLANQNTSNKTSHPNNKMEKKIQKLVIRENKKVMNLSLLQENGDSTTLVTKLTCRVY